MRKARLGEIDHKWLWMIFVFDHIRTTEADRMQKKWDMD